MVLGSSRHTQSKNMVSRTQLMKTWCKSDERTKFPRQKCPVGPPNTVCSVKCSLKDKIGLSALSRIYCWYFPMFGVTNWKMHVGKMESLIVILWVKPGQCSSIAHCVNTHKEILQGLDVL